MIGYIDPIVIGSSGALIIGILLIIGGLFARPRDWPQTRQSALILANFVAVMALVSVVGGTLTLVRAI